MNRKAKKTEFIFNSEDNCYSVYNEVETTNNSVRDFIGYVGLNVNVNKWTFQPTKQIMHYGEFTLRKIANFISKLNKQLEEKEADKNG